MFSSVCYLKKKGLTASAIRANVENHLALSKGKRDNPSSWLRHLPVAACEQERVGLQTSTCVGQRSVQMSQHSCAVVRCLLQAVAIEVGACEQRLRRKHPISQEVFKKCYAVAHGDYAGLSASYAVFGESHQLGAQ